MRSIKKFAFILSLIISFGATAQESDKSEEKVMDKESYYKQQIGRAHV